MLFLECSDNPVIAREETYGIDLVVANIFQKCACL
jgi:hypothetical protein